jgi:hypothetical protein
MREDLAPWPHPRDKQETSAKLKEDDEDSNMLC